MREIDPLVAALADSIYRKQAANRAAGEAFPAAPFGPGIGPNDALVQAMKLNQQRREFNPQAQSAPFGFVPQLPQRPGMMVGPKSLGMDFPLADLISPMGAHLAQNFLGDEGVGQFLPGVGDAIDAATAMKLGGQAVGAGFEGDWQRMGELGSWAAIAGMGALPGVDAPPLRAMASPDDPFEVLESNFQMGRYVGPSDKPIDELFGGVRMDDPAERARVEALAREMSGPEGYAARLVVDDAGNVLEGQHRLEALRLLGAKTAPVEVVQDLARDVDVNAISEAVKGVGGIHRDNVRRVVEDALGMVADEGSVAKVLEAYDFSDPATARYYRAALDAIGRLRGKDDLVAQLAKGIRAYHGSPHDFDQFSLEKIGTGEGAQAYGHGLYFAENEGVAKSYRDALEKEFTFQGKPLRAEAVASQMGLDDEASKHVFNALHDYARHGTVFTGGDLSPSERALISKTPSGRASLAVHDALAAGDLKLGSGKMYEVNIKANPEDFLDWDKPLSEQSGIVERVKQSKGYQELAAARHFGYSPEEFAALPQERRAELIARTPPSIHENILFPERPGRGLYDSIGEQAKSTELLRQAGIPGLKYLDQGSRAGGKGTRNYVVFDDKLIDIVRKYGIAGLLALPALTAFGGETEASE